MSLMAYISNSIDSYIAFLKSSRAEGYRVYEGGIVCKDPFGRASPRYASIRGSRFSRQQRAREAEFRRRQALVHGEPVSSKWIAISKHGPPETDEWCVLATSHGRIAHPFMWIAGHWMNAAGMQVQGLREGEVIAYYWPIDIPDAPASAVAAGERWRLDHPGED